MSFPCFYVLKFISHACTLIVKHAPVKNNFDFELVHMMTLMKLKSSSWYYNWPP